MIYLEYFNGEQWLRASEIPFFSEELAWISLGGDDTNYRTITEDGKILTDKREMKNGFKTTGESD